MPGDDRLDDVLSSVRELSESRDRAARNPGRGDRGTGILLGGGVLVVAVGVALASPRPGTGDAVRLVLLVLLYALSHRTEIVLPGGGAIPTQPALVGLLLTCPPWLGPLAVVVAVHLANPRVLLAPGAGWGERLLGVVVRSSAAWTCVGPAAVLMLAGPTSPSLAHLPVYVGAFLAQICLDTAVALARAASLAVAPRTVLPGLVWTFAIDALLAAIGLCIVLAAEAGPWALLVLAAPTILVRLMAQDRVRQLATAITLGAAFDAVHEEARVDPLTGLANRRAWEEAITSHHGRPDLPIGVLMADVDGLKQVNDTQGHEAGDELIRSIAALIATQAPPGSVAARLGGDEFGVLVPLRTGREATAGETFVAELREAMRVHPGVSGLALSCSLGWSSTPPLADLSEAVRQADVLAGEDKINRKAGRDRAMPVQRAKERRGPPTHRPKDETLINRSNLA